MPDQPNPRTTSTDYDAMAPFWHKVSSVLGGADALRMVGATSVAGPHLPVPTLALLNRGTSGPQSPFLPRFPNETQADYDVRRNSAPLTNIYADISENLSSKPFSKTCELAEDAAEDLKKLQSDIDGQGNNLHVFASNVFKSGIDKAITWILVEYTKVPAGQTLADERAMGARPYWLEIAPERLLAVYSTFVNGKEIVNHARIYEPCTERNGFEEVVYERVRIFDRVPTYDLIGNINGFLPATWQLWEEVEQDAVGSASQKEKVWVIKDQGTITIGIIPLIPFRTGKRSGTSWRITPPLRDIVNMQITEFQQESNLDYAKTMTAFPMLVGEGVSQSKDTEGNLISVPVGPKSVLFAPMSQDGHVGSWKWIEPDAQSLTFLQADLEKLRTEMRDLGKQPLTTGNLTVITTGQVALKANSIVQAWTISFKDALEQAFKVTCMWLGRPKEEPEVKLHKDFSVDSIENTVLDSLLKAEGQGIFSKETVRGEFKRRGAVSDDVDLEEEDQKLAEQQKGLEPDQPIDPRTGLPIKPLPIPTVKPKPSAAPARVN